MTLMPTAKAAQLDRAFHALADESRRAMVVRLSRGAADRSDEIALDRFWFETCGHGQDLNMTSVDAGYPSLSGAIKIQPLAWASAESGT